MTTLWPIKVIVTLFYLVQGRLVVLNDQGRINFQSPPISEVGSSKLNMSGPLKDIVFVISHEDLMERLPVSNPERQATEIEDVEISCIRCIRFVNTSCATYVAQSTKGLDDLLFGDRTVMVVLKTFELLTVLACVHSLNLVGIIKVKRLRF